MIDTFAGFEHEQSVSGQVGRRREGFVQPEGRGDEGEDPAAGLPEADEGKAAEEEKLIWQRCRDFLLSKMKFCERNSGNFVSLF